MIDNNKALNRISRSLNSIVDLLSNISKRQYKDDADKRNLHLDCDSVVIKEKAYVNHHTEDYYDVADTLMQCGHRVTRKHDQTVLGFVRQYINEVAENYMFDNMKISKLHIKSTAKGSCCVLNDIYDVVDENVLDTLGNVGNDVRLEYGDGGPNRIIFNIPQDSKTKVNMTAHVTVDAKQVRKELNELSKDISDMKTDRTSDEDIKSISQRLNDMQSSIDVLNVRLTKLISDIHAKD